jgi:hypothetical protein
MGKYLKQGFVRHLEWEVGRGNVSHSKMVELIEEECIKNYNQSKIKIERYEQVGELFITPTIKYLYDPKLMGYRSIDFIWLRWGFSLHLGHKK